MKRGIGLSGRTLAAGIGLMVVVGLGAGAGGYELGLRAPRAGGLTTANVAATRSPAAGPITSPVAPAAPSPTPVSGKTDSLPSPRSNPSWAYDSAAGKFLMFGGNATSGVYNEFPQPLGDTWTWDRNSWTRVTTPAPSPRYSAQLAYDDTHKVVVLFGGSTGSGGSPYEGDTWTWDGTRWLQMGPTQSPPSDGGAIIAYDASHGIAVLVASHFMATGASPVTTWIWDGTDWRQVKTQTQPLGGINSAALAYDPGRRNVLYFMHAENGQPETWTFDGAAWTKTSTNSGTSSQSFAMASDETTSKVVLYGENGDTWNWDGTKWTPVNPAHSPGPRKGMSLAYDSTRHVVTMFGGDTGQAAGLQHHNDVWNWDGADWTEVTGS